MAHVSQKVSARLSTALRRFQPIIASAKARDVGESDTVIIVTDLLSELFGYDKYAEITSETAIRGTYCDLAVKLDGAIQVLIEVKAIGLGLKDAHVKQAVDYAANQGTDWVVLTNGETWRVYKMTFAKPIDAELVLEFSLSELNSKKAADLEIVYRLTREGWIKSALGEFHTQQQALNRYFLGALVLSDPVLEVVRRELRRISPDVRIDMEQIKDVLLQSVLKREVVEGDKADEARKKISKSSGRALRVRTSKPASLSTEPAEIQVDGEVSSLPGGDI